MNGLRNFISKARGWKLVLVFLACVIGIGNVAGTRAVSNTTSGASGGVPALFQEYCIGCHGTVAPKAGVNLALMVAQPSVGESFQMWERVAEALEERAMPPKGMPQPSDEERAQALAWIRGRAGRLREKARRRPGRVTVRRLTSGEYAYTIQDLTGLDLERRHRRIQRFGRRRRLHQFRRRAVHAGRQSGALPQGRQDHRRSCGDRRRPDRILRRPRQDRVRAVGRHAHQRHLRHSTDSAPSRAKAAGRSDSKNTARRSMWRGDIKHRAALGEAERHVEGLGRARRHHPRFAEHIWTVMNKPTLGYPSSEVAARWRKLPAPGRGRSRPQLRRRARRLRRYSEVHQ